MVAAYAVADHDVVEEIKGRKLTPAKSPFCPEPTELREPKS